jgi:hypothetical protein
MAVSNGFADPQLPGATVGKPVDLAATGRLDQLDWLNLPYVSATRPAGPEAWRLGLVPVSTVDADGLTVRATGTGAGLDVVTTYAVADDPWLTADSVFTNPGTAAVTVWIGDTIDHDGPGQRSGVPGHGTIATPYDSPAAYAPTGPWIGMAGSDAQTYALRYEDTGFTAYGNGNWIQSQRQVTVPAGGSWTLRRRIIAVATTGDPWAPLAALR